MLRVGRVMWHVLLLARVDWRRYWTMECQHSKQFNKITKRQCDHWLDFCTRFANKKTASRVALGQNRNLILIICRSHLWCVVVRLVFKLLGVSVCSRTQDCCPLSLPSSVWLKSCVLYALAQERTEHIWIEKAERWHDVNEKNRFSSRAQRTM